MAAPSLILAIDQGTTSTRAILFDAAGEPIASASQAVTPIYPQPGWVEQDPESIWQTTLKVARDVLAGVGPASVAGIGISNQRETTVLWERSTGRPLANALVWQDRRTAELCERLRREGLGPHVAESTGLVIDPYFSATKIAWLLDSDPDTRARGERGEICFGTVDSWLIFRLTGGAVHVTDATNASRTMLYDIGAGQWDAKLLDRLAIPAAILPEVRDCQAAYGLCEVAHFGAPLPILGVVGDQQAAAFGQACFAPGMIKATYGTGCFVLVHTGVEKVRSNNRMLATVAWQLKGAREFALEGSIFMAGATMQWLRDDLRLFSDMAEAEAMAKRADASSGVMLVPAFQGLGAPWWDPDARGAILGLTRASTGDEVVRAGLESVAFQTADLLAAMTADMADAGLAAPTALRVDGGMIANRWLMQFLADITGLPVEAARIAETTALGAAYHAGLAARVYNSKESIAGTWRPAATYEPSMSEDERQTRNEHWRAAIDRVRTNG